MNVSLFITCFNDTLFANTGYAVEAIPLVRRFVGVHGPRRLEVVFVRG